MGKKFVLSEKVETQSIDADGTDAEEAVKSNGGLHIKQSLRSFDTFEEIIPVVPPVLDTGRVTLKARAIRSTLVISLLLHLKITMLLLHAVYCVGGVLNVDKHVICYESEHLFAAVLAWFLLIFYAVLFPLLCIRTMKRGMSSKLQAYVTQPGLVRLLHVSKVV
jgi:hypothetical protein